MSSGPGDAAGRPPTRGHHVFVPPFGDVSTLTIDGGPGHHLGTVLRVRVGEPLSVADDTGVVWQAEVTSVTRDTVVVGLVRRHEVAPPAVPLTLVQALPKGRKMDEVVQRATEVGVDRIIPVVTARCVKQPAGKDAKLLARWVAIATAAAQQSRRARVPVIEAIRPWPVADLRGVIAWEEADTSLPDALDRLLDGGPSGLAGHDRDLGDLGVLGDLSIVIGPEGGLEADEVAAAPHMIAVTLGPSILRTETAGVVGPALVAAHLRARRDT